MKAKSILTTAALITAALFILDVPAANAADKYFYHTEATAQVWSNDDANTGFWFSDAAHTTRTTQPANTDHAIIEDDCCLDANEVCQGFTVNVSVTLTLANGATGYTLEVGDQDGRTSYVDGTVLLSDDTSVLRFMYAHTVQPKTTNSDGYITGQHNSAIIDDDPNNARILTIAMDGTGEAIIQGALTIQCSLVNNSRVLANDGTTDTDGTRYRLTIDAGTFTGSGEFEVDTSIGAYSAYLEFDATGVTATGLATDFTISDGTLDCETNVTSTKNACLTFGTDGVIKCDAGVTATFY